MKDRNANKTHQQRFQGRHDQPLVPPPPQTERRETHNADVERAREEKEHEPLVRPNAARI